MENNLPKNEDLFVPVILQLLKNQSTENDMRRALVSRMLDEYDESEKMASYILTYLSKNLDDEDLCKAVQQKQPILWNRGMREFPTGIY